MSILTNQLNIVFNIEAIERDFAFIQFSREYEGGWRGALQLDRLIGEDYKAAAVMFQYSQFAFAMFRRPVDTYELISGIRNDEDFSDDAVIEVLPRTYRTEADNCICEAWLAQILVNSLASSKSRYEQFHYSNLTGHLFIIPNFNGIGKDFIDAAEVVIDKNYLLNVKIKRFRKLISVLKDINEGTISSKSIQKKPRYILHESTGTLRRWLLSDGNSDSKVTFIEQGIKGKRANLPFLDFRSSQDYNNSRAGILHHVIDNIHEHLSDYMSISLSPLETLHSVELKETILKNPKDLRSKLDGQSIRIVNKVNLEESNDLITSLKKELLPYIRNHKLLTEEDSDESNSLNIRIIHDANYYSENDEVDQYLASTLDIYRQNITIENTEMFSDSIVKTIIKELLIKRDIGEGHINLFDWKRLQAKKTWTFATCDENVKRFVFMDIFPNGNFEIRELDGNNLFGNDEYQEYIEVITEVKNEDWKTHLFFEGLIISGGGDMNLIFLTEKITIPDLINIKKIIVEKDASLPHGLRTGKELALVVEECFAKSPEAENKKINLLKEGLNEIGNKEIQKDDFRKILNLNLGKTSNAAAKLRNYLLEKHNVRMIFPKDKQSKNSLFDSNLNIKYFGKTDYESYYCVGDRRDNVQFSFKDACRIRKIKAIKESKLVFKELLQTMDVDFVRTGQSTVLPFPLKYLREYMKIEGK